jgi:hypothetical protein
VVDLDGTRGGDATDEIDRLARVRLVQRSRRYLAVLAVLPCLGDEVAVQDVIPGVAAVVVDVFPGWPESGAGVAGDRGERRDLQMERLSFAAATQAGERIGLELLPTLTRSAAAMVAQMAAVALTSEILAR